MVAVPIITELVAIQLVFCVLLVIYLLLQCRTVLLCFVELLALVHAMRIVTIYAPVAEAIPAKLVTTAARVIALHSNTALILLDRLLALWTLLRVGFQPEVVLIIVLFLVQPH